MKKRNSLIEFYRFFFALNVVKNHGFFPEGFHYFSPGRVSVEFFFVLSGYLFVRTLDKLKDMLKTEEFDVEAVKAQTEAVSKKFYDVSSKLYADAAQAQQSAGGAGAEGAAPNDENVVDADYTVVDDEQ